MKFRSLSIGLVGTVLLFVGGLAVYDRISVGASSIPVAESQALDALPMQVESFHSQAMGRDRQYGIILPPGYAEHPDQRYPVMFLLHGGHDNLRAYADQYGIAQVLQQLYAAHKLPPTIVVMPDGNDNRGSSYLWDPQYYNGPNGNLDTLIGSELVQQVKTHYRTLDGPQFWAMGGVSSGGWGAVNIGLKHLDTFGTLFSHGGYFTDSSGAQNSPESFIKTIAPEKYRHLHVYMDAGDNGEDADMRASSEAFHQTLDQLGVSNVMHVFSGGHGLSGPDIGWNYFHKHLTDSLTYAGQQFEQAQVQ